MWWNNERIIYIIINCVIKDSENVQVIVLQTDGQTLLSGSSTADCNIISLIYFGVYSQN